MDFYFYIDENKNEVGPVDVERLVRIVTPSTLIWKAGMENWTPAELVEEVAERLKMVAPPQFEQNELNESASVANTKPASRVSTFDAKGKGTYAIKPNNYLVWAILSTILFFLPLGIVAVVFAAKVDSAWENGDYAKAVEASGKAKLFSLLAFVCGLILYAIFFIKGFVSL